MSIVRWPSGGGGLAIVVAMEKMVFLAVVAVGVLSTIVGLWLILGCEDFEPDLQLGQLAIVIPTAAPVESGDGCLPPDNPFIGQSPFIGIAYGPCTQENGCTATDGTLVDEDGQNLLDLYLPDPPGAGPTPLILYVHGGGFHNGGRQNAGHYTSYFPSRGVAVASMDHRYSTQFPYDLDWTEDPAWHQDGVKAVQFLRYWAKNDPSLNIDPDRIAFVGSSSGAGIAQWVSLHDDFANPASCDFYERESSRPNCLGTNMSQTTYDMRLWWPADLENEDGLFDGCAADPDCADGTWLPGALFDIYGINRNKYIGDSRFRAQVDLDYADHLDTHSPLTYLDDLDADLPVIMFYPNGGYSDYAVGGDPGPNHHAPQHSLYAAEGVPEIANYEWHTNYLENGNPYQIWERDNPAFADDDCNAGQGGFDCMARLESFFLSTCWAACVSPCPADLDGDCTVGTADLLDLLGQWGTDPGGPPDFDGDMNVGTADLLELLSNWGPCL
jgi:hypothetical protein